MLKIGLFGYGKMGRAIESLLSAQHNDAMTTIAWRITQENRTAVTPELLRQADVVIEFTRPEVAFENVMLCLRAGVPVVSGTTGWLKKLSEAQDFCQKNGGALLWASNFSVGVNLFFALNSYLSKLMNERAEYAPSVTEIHHVHKLDAPSGTAVTLVHELIAQANRFSGWELAPIPPKAGEVPVTAIREGEVPGTHVVKWQSAIDEISIEHRAHSRAGFASGAILAAKWLAGKRGVFTMKDVLGLNDL
jgi:4-hydroxy-tetrahydrodipicolinate reductase